MALPDTLERIGVVVGCTILISLPVSALSSILLGPVGYAPYLGALLLAPGLVVGLLLATDRLPLSYHEVWQFALVSWLVAAVGASVFGLGESSRPALVVAWWLVSVAVGLLVARARVRESLAAAVR